MVQEQTRHRTDAELAVAGEGWTGIRGYHPSANQLEAAEEIPLKVISLALVVLRCSRAAIQTRRAP